MNFEKDLFNKPPQIITKQDEKKIYHHSAKTRIAKEKISETVLQQILQRGLFFLRS